MNDRCALLVLLLCHAACGTVTTEREPIQEVAIPELRVRIRLPIGTRVGHLDGRTTFSTDPGTRSDHSFDLQPSGDSLAETDEFSRWLTLTRDSRIQYRISARGGGSGGDEESLAGILTVGPLVFMVNCHDQAEPPAAPYAERCLEWLATVRIEPGRSRDVP